MARQIRRFGPYALVLFSLIAVVLLMQIPEDAEAATSYVDPFWTNNSSSPECPGCGGCGCVRPSEVSPEGVSNRTGELFLDFPLFSTPGMLGDNVFSLRWRSEISGLTQMGRGMLPSWEHSVRKVILIPGNPDGNGGHEVEWRRPDGLVVVYDWDGSEYSTSDCAIYHDLTLNSPYKLTDKYGAVILFAQATGMIDKYTDRNGNITDFTYNSSYQLTALSDDRGKTYTISHNSDGFIEYISDPSSRRWDFSYDTSGNLTAIDTPNTDDQTTGITTTITYDGSNRVLDIEDGQGNTVNEYTWTGATRQIDKVTIGGDDVDFSFGSSPTIRTDRNGNVHRTHYTGRDITKTDMWIASQAEYATTYTYSGSVVATIVYPRGNRIDFTYDGSDNRTKRRHKTTNTSSNNAADLVHTWAYTSHFVTSYTDPEGNATTYTRDSSGNVTKITFPTVSNPASQSADKDIEYNSSGQVTKITDEEEKIV